MREHGVVRSAGGLGLNGHACWLYSDQREFSTAVVRFLADGVTLGQKLAYVGEGSPESLRRDLAALPGVDRLIRNGSLDIHPLESLYDIYEPVDAEQQLARFATAMDAAVRDGWTGLRVVADVAALVADPSRREAHLRWEHVAERFIASNPLAALCCYDTRRLPQHLVTRLACLHPVAHGKAPDTPFRLYARASTLALEGEVDYFSADALADLLPLAVPDGEHTVLELDELRFIDHRGVMALADRSRGVLATGGSVAVLQRTRNVRVVCEALGLSL